jgi:hypothetical protein
LIAARRNGRAEQAPPLQKKVGATGSDSRYEDSIESRAGKKKSGEGEEPFPPFGGGGGLFFLSLSGTWWCALAYGEDECSGKMFQSPV